MTVVVTFYQSATRLYVFCLLLGHGDPCSRCEIPSRIDVDEVSLLVIDPKMDDMTAVVAIGELFATIDSTIGEPSV